MPFTFTTTIFGNFNFEPAVTVLLDQIKVFVAVVRGTVGVVSRSTDGVGYRCGVLEACRAPELEATTHRAITDPSSDFLIFIPRV